jgi:hypothetical protein
LLIDAIFSANRESPILFDQQKLAAVNINKYVMHDDLLVHQNRLVVSNEDILRTRLCDEFHRPAHRAHPGRGKMRKMIFQQYFWPEIGLYINRYVGNCPECKRSRSSRLKPAGLLHPYPNVYEIDLPSGIKARRFLNASRLIKARDDPVPGQLLKPKDSVAINGKLE